MNSRKKLTGAAAMAEALLAALIALAPKFIFPVCEERMHCHESWMAELGVAATVFASAMMMLASKGMEARRLLAVVSAVGGVFAVLFPSYLIGVCGSPMMACRYGLLPVWNLSGGLLVLISCFIFFAAREEEA